MKKNRNKLHRFIKEDLKNKGIEIPKELLSLKKAYNSNEVKQLISYNDFKNFLVNKIVHSRSTSTRGTILTLNALQVRSKRFIDYEDMDSNKQFITLYNLNNTQLLAMLNYFVGQSDTEHIINMIKNSKSDEDILSYIKKHFKLKNTRNIKEFTNSKIATFTTQFVFNREKLENENQEQTYNILDLGVGNGKKIKSICSLLDIKYNLYGADIEEWGKYNKNRKLDFPYKVIQLHPYKIPYSDKMFDCIYITLTLHHAEDILAVLNECHRILKDNGFIILIEHDVWSDDTNMLVDLQHRIYAYSYDEDINSAKATYYNYLEWDILFDKCGFKFIMGNHISEDIAYNLRYDMQLITVYSKKEFNYSKIYKR